MSVLVTVPRVDSKPKACHHCGGKQLYEEEDFNHAEYHCLTCGCVHLTIKPMPKREVEKKPMHDGEYI